jgi:hypothetical protein
MEEMTGGPIRPDMVIPYLQYKLTGIKEKQTNTLNDHK